MKRDLSTPGACAEQQRVYSGNGTPPETERRIRRALAYCRECGERPVFDAIGRQFGVDAKTVSRIARESKP